MTFPRASEMAARAVELAAQDAREEERERCKRLVLSAGDGIVSTYTMELLKQIAAKIEGKE